VSHVEERITRAHYDEWARVAAALTRHFGDLDGLHRVGRLIRVEVCQTCESNAVLGDAR
jgi:hypothetical protein